MYKPRYSFAVIIRKNKLFAIGGASYGKNDQIRLLKNVEYFDFDKWKWI